MNFIDDTSSDEEYEPGVEVDEEEDMSDTEVEDSTIVNHSEDEEDAVGSHASTPLQADDMQTEEAPSRPPSAVVEPVPLLPGTVHVHSCTYVSNSSCYTSS